jgi:hypothetical protein
MKFEDIILKCHANSIIYRKGNPKIKYPKHDFIPLKERVPKEEQKYNDWSEYDPEQEFGHY